MRLCFSCLALLTILAGCQGPILTGGFNHSPYRAYGVDGPGPGVISDNYQPMSYQNPAECPTPAPEVLSGPIIGGGMPCPPCVAPTSQINFIGLESLTINWDTRMLGMYDSEPLVCPATYDFPQGNIYRLKLSNVPGRQGKELYPTLEIAPTMARTQAFLAHNAIPVEFTDNDFDQVFSGNFITKVIYLPNPEYQGLAMAGVGTLVNTQLEPGVDPIVEASNRGAILAIIRMGNKDLGLKTAMLQKRQATMPQDGMPFDMPQGYVQGMPVGAVPQGAYPVGPGSSIPQNAISGVNIAKYGTPMTKTSVGIPGPPQLPRGQHSPNRYPVVRAEPIPAAPRSIGVDAQNITMYPQYTSQMQVIQDRAVSEQPMMQSGMQMQQGMVYPQHMIDLPNNAVIVNDSTLAAPKLAPQHVVAPQ